MSKSKPEDEFPELSERRAHPRYGYAPGVPEAVALGCKCERAQLTLDSQGRRVWTFLINPDCAYHAAVADKVLAGSGKPS